MKLVCFLIPVLITFSIVGCTTKHQHELRQSDIEVFAQSWIEHKSSELLSNYPEAKAQQVADKTFRYTIDFETHLTTSEIWFTTIEDERGYYTPKAYIRVSFIALNGIIQSYSTKRISGRKMTNPFGGDYDFTE